MTKEHQRLAEPGNGPVPPWSRWGPYLAERSWATVREDYSPDGRAWEFLPHDLARSKAYRWGEDGLAGFCDRYQLLVFGLALWNERDPILKERLFGLTPSEGNHGEDVKECYYYLDATPTHSYSRYLYKYPQAEFPYALLVRENQRRSTADPEYELWDTGIFDTREYFDVFVEYAKADPEDICIRIQVINRGNRPAPIRVLPHLWFRNRWAWRRPPRPEPRLWLGSVDPRVVWLEADDADCPPLNRLPFEYRVGRRYLYADAGAEPLFTNNETHAERVFGPSVQSRSHYVKDAFHRCLVQGEADCVNPELRGTKACLHYSRRVKPGESIAIRLRLTDRPLDRPLEPVDEIINLRRLEADEFYEAIHPANATEDERRIQRQALAGLLWSKQAYLFDVHDWLHGDDPEWPPPASRRRIRNIHWRHLNSKRVMSMPDKWEYPWFAAWDLAFQAVPLTLVDPEFAKQQLWLLLFEQFQHPSGQIPAYEWEFSDLNPPVHAWAVWRVYNMDRVRSGRADRAFLEKCFHKLLINFTWWVNKVDREGHNVFEGGFLGLDNITVVDRSDRMPDGAVLLQSDGTGWMGMFCLNMMRIALELAKDNRVYEGLATKFFEHYVYIGSAMKNMGQRGYELWDEKDGFFYDVLRYPDGSFHQFRVRSLVGLIPMFAIERLEEDWLKPFPDFHENLRWFLEHRQDLVEECVTTLQHNGQRVHVLAIMNPEQMRRLLQRIWDPEEFRSPFGLRSLSKFHQQHPFIFSTTSISYEPAESRARLKGGNSNWRGPIWFPMTFMMIESLRKLRKAYGHRFVVPAIDPDSAEVTLDDMARGFAQRLIALFARDSLGRRPIFPSHPLFLDPQFRDYLFFHEYFHADSGQGLGAAHQTGWTALIASLIDEWRR